MNTLTAQGPAPKIAGWGPEPLLTGKAFTTPRSVQDLDSFSCLLKRAGIAVEDLLLSERAEPVLKRHLPTVIPCTVLLNPHHPVPPRHVCENLLPRLVKQYVSSAYPPRNSAERQWVETWPLPAGENSLRRFATSEGLDPIDLPRPLIAGVTDAHIGLWVERRVPDGFVRLLGLVEPSEEATPDTWRFVARDLIINDFGDGISSKILERLAALYTRWYRLRILRVTLPAGRNPGETEWLETVKRVYPQAVRRARQQKGKLSASAISTALAYYEVGHVPESSLRYWVEKGYLPQWNEVE